MRGWDDPRLGTLNGLRRRGYTPEAINAFCRDIGVSRSENLIQQSKLEFHLRAHLDVTARRGFAVLRPLRVTLVNVPAGETTWLEAPDFPRDRSLGVHKVALTRELVIEADDFRLADDKDFFGLAPGKVAGLRYGGYVRVLEVVAGPSGAPAELRCEYDAGRSPAAGKVKGNLHWVSAGGATAEVRLYENLFTTEEPGSTGDWVAELNPHSEAVLHGVHVDAFLGAPGAHKVGDAFQFERLGFFVVDKDSDCAAGRYVFNQTVSLKESGEVKKAAK